MYQTIRSVVIISALTFTAISMHAKSLRAADQPLLSLRAFAVDMSTSGGGRAGTLDIVIERWSTEADRQMLRDALVEQGSDKLLSTLQRMKPRAGFIRSANSLGWDIHYAREETSPVTGGRRIVFATDRPMSQWEMINRPRSADYEFTFGEIRIGADGKGEGKLVPAARVHFDKDTQVVEIENYASEPVRLTTVTAEKK